MSMKSKMKDEMRVMDGWDINSVDPCTWNMVGCSVEGFVISLYAFLILFIFLYFFYYFYPRNKAKQIFFRCKKTGLCLFNLFEAVSACAWVALIANACKLSEMGFS